MAIKENELDVEFCHVPGAKMAFKKLFVSMKAEWKSIELCQLFIAFLGFKKSNKVPKTDMKK